VVYSSIAVRWKNRYIPRFCRVYLFDDVYLVTWSSRGGFVYASTTGPLTSPRPADNRQRVHDSIREGPVKKKNVASLRSAAWHADDDAVLEGFPLLSEFMRSATYEDSTDPRDAPTITIWCAGGLWKAAVKDRAEGLVMWLSDSSLFVLLTLLNGMVLSEDAPWRHDSELNGQKGKRVKHSS